MLVTLNILETLLDTKMPGTNVQRDNTSTKFTCLQLSISFQYWKKPKTTSRVPAVWHLYHRELVFQLYIIIFLLPQAVLPVHNSLICVCYNSSPWGGFGSFCESRIKCFHRLNLGWSCQHRGRRCRRSSWGRGSIYTVKKRHSKRRIEKFSTGKHSWYWLETMLKTFHSSTSSVRILFPLFHASVFCKLCLLSKAVYDTPQSFMWLHIWIKRPN